VPLRRVVHAQVVTDLSHNYRARVEAHADREAEFLLALELLRVALEILSEVERRIAGALRVVLVGDRRSEERHDPVARVLVDRALEAMHPVGQDLEEAIHDLVPLLQIDALLKIHGALDIREEHGHLLALPFQGAAEGQDLVDQVLGRVVPGDALPFQSLGPCRRHCASPCESASFPHAHPLNFDQLLDQLVESAVVEVELALESPTGDAPVAFQKCSSPLDGLQKTHRSQLLSDLEPILLAEAALRGGYSAWI